MYFVGVAQLLGISLNIIASGKARPAVSYGLEQGATVVAALRGIYVWKEFDKTPTGAQINVGVVNSGFGDDYFIKILNEALLKNEHITQVE